MEDQTFVAKCLSNINSSNLQIIIKPFEELQNWNLPGKKLKLLIEENYQLDFITEKVQVIFLGHFPQNYYFEMLQEYLVTSPILKSILQPHIKHGESSSNLNFFLNFICCQQTSNKVLNFLFSI